jgi:hypothetical protein
LVRSEHSGAMSRHRDGNGHWMRRGSWPRACHDGFRRLSRLDLLAASIAARGTFATCRPRRTMSVLRITPENICSGRVLLSLTHYRPFAAALVDGSSGTIRRVCSQPPRRAWIQRVEPSHVIILGLAIAVGGVIWQQWRRAPVAMAGLQQPLTSYLPTSSTTTAPVTPPPIITTAPADVPKKLAAIVLGEADESMGAG